MISKNGKKAKVQEKLNESALKITGPKEFTKDGILHATTQFVVSDDQVGILRPQCCLIDWWSATSQNRHSPVPTPAPVEAIKGIV